MTQRHIPADLLQEPRMSQRAAALDIEVGYFPRVLPQDPHCVPRSPLADRMLIVATPLYILITLLLRHFS